MHIIYAHMHFKLAYTVSIIIIIQRPFAYRMGFPEHRAKKKVLPVKSTTDRRTYQ